MRDGEEWEKKGYLKTINIMWVIKAMTLIQEMRRWWLKYKTEHYTLQVSRSGDKFLYFKLPNMYCEGQKISFSCVAIAHSQAYIITDLCWQEQIVSTKGTFPSATSSVPQRSSGRILRKQSLYTTADHLCNAEGSNSICAGGISYTQSHEQNIVWWSSRGNLILN